VRNSSGTMRRAWFSRRVLLPGSRSGHREAVGSVPGFGFRSDHIGPIDSANASKTHTERSVCSCVAVRRSGGEGMVANPPWRLRNHPAYGASCGAFPGYGQLSTSRHFLSDTIADSMSRHGPASAMRGGEKNFMTAASGVPPDDDGAAAASRSNSSGVRYPNAECSRRRL
jgi:hypothetical protein